MAKHWTLDIKAPGRRYITHCVSWRQVRWAVRDALPWFGPEATWTVYRCPRRRFRVGYALPYRVRTVVPLKCREEN